MKGEFLCVGVIPEVWFQGTKDEQAVKVLNLLDKTTHLDQVMKNTIDYRPTKEEAEQLDLDKLDGNKITIGVSDWMFKNGRIKLRGRIDPTTLPKGVRRDGSRETTATAVARP